MTKIPQRMTMGIRAHGLGKKFDDTWVVQDLSFEVERGEVYGLLGPNGAGKTTTLRMLAGLYAADTGHIEICGRSPTTARRGGQLGLLTEQPGFYDRLSTEYNLVYFARLYGISKAQATERADTLLRRFDLHKVKTKPFAVLSRGMKQKLALARALIHDPEVILLDEPTVGLDPKATAELRSFVRELAHEGRSILMCTHHLAEVEKLCSRVAFLARHLITVRDTQFIHTDGHDTMHVSLTIEPVSQNLWLGLSELEGVQRREDQHTTGQNKNLQYEVFTLTQPQQLPVLVAWLVNNNVRVHGVERQTPTLERAYIDLLAAARADGIAD